MTSYRITMKKKPWGWTSQATGFNGADWISGGDFVSPRWWWRPNYQWASDCAHRWCQRHYNRTSANVFTVDFTPVEKDR